MAHAGPTVAEAPAASTVAPQWHGLLQQVEWVSIGEALVDWHRRRDGSLHWARLWNAPMLCLRRLVCRLVCRFLFLGSHKACDQ